MSEEPHSPTNPTTPPGGPAPPPSTLRRIFFNDRELRAGWRLSIYVVLAAAFVQALVLAARSLHLPLFSPQHPDAARSLTWEILQAIAVYGVAVLLGKFERRTIGTYGLPLRQAFRGRFWQGMLWGFGLITAILLLIAALGGFSLGQFAVHGGAILHYGVLWLLAMLAVAFTEEFAFRGYMQFTLGSGMGFWPAAILLSAGFAAAHLGNPGANPLAEMSIFATAMFLCFTLRRTGDLWFAVGLHAAIDWAAIFIYSVPAAGIVAHGRLLDSSFHGPKWLTGGTFGPYASVMTLVVLGVAFVLFALLYRRPPDAPAATTPHEPLHSS